MTTIAIIDYGMGNLFSIHHALKYIGTNPVITSDPSVIASADRLILPGVGAFQHAMWELEKRNLTGAIKECIDSGRPVLGICLGMQLLFTESREFGCHQGLDVIKGKVVRFSDPQSSDEPFKIPQIGWNAIVPVSRIWQGSLLDGIAANSFFYFVHSYICRPEDGQAVLAETLYGNDRFCSVTNKGNVWGCQFHPEKSGEVGLQVYRNFSERL